MSVSSLEGSPVPLDLATKYQKIASEYAKIRAQCSVLKKAVVDEQSNSAELKEILRLKDQNLRKAEQEIDSLNFRNQHLTKRLSILQDELDTLQNPVKKNKSKNISREIPNSILSEELQKKISENAQLVSMLQEQTEKYENEKFKLVQSQEMFEHELEECKKKLVNVEETRLAKLENENKLLSAKLNAKEEALQKLYNENKVLRNKAYEKGNEMCSDEFKEKCVNLLQTLDVEDLLRTIITFFHKFEIRYSKCIDNTVLKKFSNCIEKNVSILGDFVNYYSSYCIHVSNNNDFLSGIEYLSKNINSYIILLDELSLYLTSRDEEINKIFEEIILSFKNHWIQFHSTVKLCFTPAKVASDSEECTTALADVFRSLRSSCDYFSSTLTDKFRDPELQDKSEKEILASISKIGVQSNIIYKKLTENKALVKSIVEHRPNKHNDDVIDKGNDCCEHWKQKFETMNSVYKKKVKDLEEQISCLSGTATPGNNHSENNVQSSAESKEKSPEISNTFGVLTDADELPRNPENQDSELTKYFNARANILIADRQFAESKVTTLKNECEVLQKRLEHSIDCRNRLEASVKQSQETVIRLQEELTTTSTNYELQLSSLSEHMANMNDKLASQQEEIEVLKYQLLEKGTKKGKSK